MAFNQATAIYLIGGVIVLFAIMALARKEKKVAGLNKGLVGFVLLLVGGFLVLGQYGALSSFGVIFAISDGGDGSSVSNTNPVNTIATYQPTAAYSGKDKFSSTTVTGTSYYKPNQLPATTTAYSNVNVGDDVTYWIDNGTYYVTPIQRVVGTGVNSFTALAYQNATVSVTGYDLTNRQSTANGAYNASMAANKQANIEITYQGTAKKSAAPFGGVMVVEYNSTISSVTCTGDDLLSSNPFQVTYSTAQTPLAYKVYAFGSSLDDGTGSVKRISCQFLNGNTAAGAGSVYYVNFLPANYYLSNDGRILLDVEKSANSDNTRTQITNTIKLTSYWGA